jgi:hypothetical protein
LKPVLGCTTQHEAENIYLSIMYYITMHNAFLDG